MANGFTNLPTSLLGAVSIGGNLVVQGTTRSVGALSTDASLAVGVTPNITRVGNFTGYGPGISGNLALDAATRDNAGVTAALLAMGANGNSPKRRLLNAAGTALDEAIADFLGSDFTLHTAPAGVGENTIVTRTIPANTLGLNGGFVVEVAWAVSIDPGVNLETLRVRLGGVQLVQSAPSAVVNGYVRIRVANRGAANSQHISGFTTFGTALEQIVNATAAVDTTADQPLIVTVQKGVGTDTVRVDMVAVSDANSFGPV